MENKSYTIALTGNPNVGKSTVFNTITGLNQHTGNWSGKTVEVCRGEYIDKGRIHKIIDLPGSYSVFAESEEEMVTKNYIDNNEFDVLVIVADANALERNLSFTLQILSKTSKAVLCINMIDIAEKNGVYIDTEELSIQLGIPVVKTSAKKKKGISELMTSALGVAENRINTYFINSIRTLTDIDDVIELSQKISDKSREICNLCVKTINRQSKYNKKLDRIFTSKLTGIPIMIIFVLVLFWLTAYGANYPSELLSSLFSYLITSITTLFNDLCIPQIITSFLCEGVLKTVGWVVAVMLPPAMIFFPVFALLEDFGYLPRVAFNLDGFFCKAGTSGKQALTMMMGFGCNACGIVGCRIISSQKERKIAMITNSFIPCNGRIPTLIALSTIFFSAYCSFPSFITAMILLILISVSVLITLLVSKLLATIFYKDNSAFIMELPGYKRPQFFKTIALTIKNKVLSILLRAIYVALPAGAVIWILANITVYDQSLLRYVTNFLDPLGRVMGVDGTVITAFILGFPANEIVIPVMLMSYTAEASLTDLSSLSSFANLLASQGWNNITAICTLILCIFHFPCSTTCITIYKETKSKLVVFLSIIIPLVIGFILCFIINQAYQIFF